MRMTFSTPTTPAEESDTRSAGTSAWTSGSVLTGSVTVLTSRETGGMRMVGPSPERRKAMKSRDLVLSTTNPCLSAPLRQGRVQRPGVWRANAMSDKGTLLEEPSITELEEFRGLIAEG